MFVFTCLLDLTYHLISIFPFEFIETCVEKLIGGHTFVCFDVSLKHEVNQPSLDHIVKTFIKDT